MTHFDLTPEDIPIKGECVSVDDIDFYVSMSVRLPYWNRHRTFRGKVSMTLLRSPRENTETDHYGVILPKRWVKSDWETGRAFGIFEGRGDYMDAFVKKIAEVISNDEIECYVGMLTGDYRMPIDEQRYEELKSAHDFLMELHSFESLYDTVTESYKRYMKYIADLSIDSAFESMWPITQTHIASIFKTATIDCTAFLSLFRLYWETLSGSDGDRGQRFFFAPQESAILEKIMKDILADNPKQIDYIVEGLCPLALHGRPIADFVSWNHRRKENDYHHWFSSSVKIETTDRIPTYIRNKAKNWLKDTKPMPESFAEGMEALSEVRLKIRDVLESRTMNARSSIENVIEEWKEQADENHSAIDIDNLFSVFGQNKGCGLYKDESPIGLSHDKHTRLLEEKRHRTPSFSKLLIEITERHNKNFLSDYKIALMGRFPSRKKLEDELEARGASVLRISKSVDMVIKAGELTENQKQTIEKHSIMVVEYSLITKLIDRSTPPESPDFLHPVNVFPSRQEHFVHILEHYKLEASALQQAS